MGQKAPRTDSSAPVALEGTIDGRSSPLRLHGEVVFGAQLPALTAMCQDASVLRHILIHEFSHCFFEIVRAIESMSRGETRLEDRFNVFDSSADDSRMEDPKDWFGGDDANLLAHHNDPVFEPIQWRLDELQTFLPVLVPETRFEIRKLDVAVDVAAHARELLRRRKGVR
jgi:hypothetical protein